MPRESGILLAVSSLPSSYGIGSMGKEAYAFVDFLADAEQRVWQVLPLGPTGFGDSPYQTFSAFAGNPYLIDLDMLIGKGLLTREETGSREWGNDPGHVDYGRLYEGRFPLLRLAASRFFAGHPEAERFRIFAEREKAWLEPYALFMALKDHFGGADVGSWPEDIRMHSPETVARYADLLREETNAYRFMQYEFSEQWFALKSYANARGISILGDIPIYASSDSADVWAEPGMFLLDERRRPLCVAGVPPDYFCEDGQLWGNPLYDWERMRLDGFRWWIARLRRAGELYDRIRLDHFRGISTYWAVPAGDRTARNGKWVKGPGMELIEKIREELPGLTIIAEDLGILTEDVYELLENSGYPGMKVLQFAFNAFDHSDYLPHRYGRSCVCYTGTHDNTTLFDWAANLSPEDRAFAETYVGSEDLPQGIIRAGMGSVADLFMAQMQDYLSIDGEGRMNTPGVNGKNWQWRMLPGMLTKDLSEQIAKLVHTYDR